MKPIITKCLQSLKDTIPLVHCITNYVTVNDCANALLAIGASPVMADDQNEAADIVSICQGLLINIGTLNERTIESMLLAGKKANENGIPVVLDPVGIGASEYRKKCAFRLLREIRFAVIRGNISEIMVLASGAGSSLGVDANIGDALNQKNIQQLLNVFNTLSAQTHAVIAVSGQTDLIVTPNHAVLVRNGHELLPQITGSGCMLGALTAAYVAANRERIFDAALAATIHMGLAGEWAATKLQIDEYTGTFRTKLIDQLGLMSPVKLEQGAKYEVQ